MATFCLGQESFKNWEKSGKAEFLKSCKLAIKGEGTESIWTATKEKSLKRCLHEVCWQTIKGSLKQDLAVLALNEVSDLHPDVSSLLADVLSLIDVELLCNDDKSQREKFIALTRACMPTIPESLLKERLDTDTLEQVGLVQSKSAFQTKYVKTKTRLYYKQQKFNLLREENEGYAKLVAELGQDSTTVDNIKSLIGCFDLDPNRVLDIILESFECRPELDAFFVPLIKCYISASDVICHMIGHKFHFYQETQEFQTPASLYKVTALLLHHRLIELDSLYPHLRPSDNDINEQHKRDISDAKAYLRKLNVVSLVDKANEDKEKEKETEKETKNEQYVYNQKLGLIEALLKIEDWEQAQNVISRLPPYFATSHRPVAQALCKMVHNVMEPLYRKHNGLPKALTQKTHSQQLPPSKIPQAETYHDLATKVYPILYHLGPHLSCDPILMVKVMRICRQFLSKWKDEKEKSNNMKDVYYGMLTLIDEVILPSLSLLDGNCCMSEEVWCLVKMFPYEYRYRLYGQWKNDTCSSQAVLIRLKGDSIEKAKYILKRLTKENVKPLGRQIGKLSHNNPGIIFEYVLSQIQKYDNFIGPVVDSLKYLTSLSYDILAYCIIEALANPEKERMKYDDSSLSTWIQSLANFAGSICRKYQIELAGLLQYVINQLKAGKSYDMLILREVMTKMSGIEVTEDISDDQLAAMAGGENLRIEGGYFAQVRNTKKSSTRLKEALLEHELALPLCYLMSQQRDCTIFSDGPNRHNKLVAKLFDQCQDTLVQFGTFLATQMSTDEYIKKLPSIGELVSIYHIPPDAAFFLARHAYTHSTNMKYEELRKQDKKNKEEDTDQKKTTRYQEAANAILSSVIDSVRPLYTAKIWDELSPQFYVTFWTLMMYDIEVPTSAYSRQQKQYDIQISAIEYNHDLVQSKKKKEKDRCTQLIERLREEKKKQEEHVVRVIARLDQERESWFTQKGSTKNETITQFLQLCIFPRLCFSGLDAVFCAKFIHILHQLKTPNFSTLICYDRIFCDVTNTVTCCTENEAHRYGRFLCSALNSIMHWHANKLLYDQECAQFPGFVTVFRKGADSNNKADQLEYENYRHVCHKWHYRITKAMVACLESGNYVQIRNALIVLTKILTHYPRVQQFGQALERRVERIKEEEREKRPDIYAIAVGYSGQLKSKKSTWVAEQDFHIKDVKEAPKLSTVKTTKTVVENGTSASSSSKENSHSKKDDVKDRDGKAKEGKKASESKPSVKTENKAHSSSKSTSNSVDSKVNIRDMKKEPSSSNSKSSSSSSKETRERGEDRAKVKREAEDRPQKEPRDKERGGHGDGDKEKSHSREKETKASRQEKKKEARREEKERRKEERREHEAERDKHHTSTRDDHPHKQQSLDDRSPSVTSIGSQNSHRRSVENSPRNIEDRDRDLKRRKLDTTKEDDLSGKDIDLKSPQYEKERDRDKERKLERKRDRSSDIEAIETKRRRNDEASTSISSTPGGRSSKTNGDNISGTETPHSIRDKERSRDKAHDRSYSEKNEDRKIHVKKEPKDHESPRDKERKDKHGSTSAKKSKK
ncbi:THO complex subunit 2-like isoform X2 [Tubulanus polymorphus]|uniref:THO complex subunit 2-like isoform X2 n=1 Tax=Tubulanus polymorphus TaxID=672921 RepID=UPI003DA3734A